MASKDLTIFVVEDNPNDYALLQAEVLDTFDAKLIRARSGAEAQIMFAFHDDSLVLLDLNLGIGTIGGMDILSMIVEKRGTQKLIILSGSGTDSDMQRVYQMGIRTYITKPLTFQKFIRAIRELGLKLKVVE